MQIVIVNQMNQYYQYILDISQQYQSHPDIERNTLVIIIFTIFLLNKSNVFKYLRMIQYHILVIFLIYRCIYYCDNESSILSIILNLIQLIQNKYFSTFIYDLFGILIIIQILAFINKVLSLSYLEWRKIVLDEVFSIVKYLPPVQDFIRKEQVKVESDFDRDLKSKSRELGISNITLPKKGMSSTKILQLMKDCSIKEIPNWKTGRVSGAVYHGKPEHQDLLNKAFGYYSIANPLHPDLWPSGMKFEAEIISMTASLVNGGIETVCGCTTSGGTESIILAIKAHRDYYCNKFNIKHPEIVCSISAHAAVDKACDMMGIRLIKVKMDPLTYKVDVNAVRNAISPNTILIYSSAPSYPQGVIDPIEKLSKLAIQYKVGLHVDCCLGGFVLPFAKKLGYSYPDFDFCLPGVTSMSLDTHKYGYALKGTSVVLYRNRELRHAQYFCYADWSGGLYTTPTIAGSRSGGLISQCWASLMALGEEGYLKHTRDIIETTRRIADGVSKIYGLQVIGNAEVMIVCFIGVNGVNVYAVADRMSKKGWSLNSHQHPSSVHICVTVTHVDREVELLNDLQECVNEVISDPNAKSKSAAIYGMTSSMPTGPVNDMLKIYNDVVLKV